MVVVAVGALHRTSVPSAETLPRLKVTGTWPGAVHVNCVVAIVGVAIVPELADHVYAMALGSAAVAVVDKVSELPTVVSEGVAVTLVHEGQLGAWASLGACASPASVCTWAWATMHCTSTVTLVVAPAAMLKFVDPLHAVPPSGDMATIVSA
jgi:hypothetical protein